MEAITNTTNEQKCNQNIVDAIPALYAFALQQQVPVSDTFCWHSQYCSPGAVCLHTRIKLYEPQSDLHTRIKLYEPQSECPPLRGVHPFIWKRDWQHKLLLLFSY